MKYLQPLNESRANNLPDCVVTVMGRATLRKETAVSEGKKSMAQIAIDDVTEWQARMSQLQELMQSVNPNARLELDETGKVLIVIQLITSRNNKGMQFVTRTAAQFLEMVGQQFPAKSENSLSAKSGKRKKSESGITAAQRTAYLGGNKRVWNREAFLLERAARQATAAS